MMGLRLKIFAVCVVLTVGLIVIGGCSTSMPEMPDTSAESLIVYLEESDYRNNWELWPRKGERYAASGPHGMLLTIYLNPIAFDAIKNNAGHMPNGSIVVKESFTPDSEFLAYTVMYKKDEYNPDHNDWFWLKARFDGKPEEAGKVRSCQVCHSQVSTNDYIWTGSLR